MNKYHNVPTMLDNIKFASKKEAARYQELKLLQQAGKISAVLLQPAFPIKVNGQLICSYYADFGYFDHEKQETIYEDVKSSATRTQVYRLKKKLVKALFDIDIREV